MRRRPVVFFAGARAVAMPYAVCLSALIVLGGACALSLLDSVLPGLVGTAPILPVPDRLQSVANVLGYFSGIAMMLAAMAFAWGRRESRLAAARFTDFERLIPFAEVLASGLDIAPNVSERDRGIVSIMAPASVADMEAGSVDRLLVLTTEGASEFRRLVRGLMCDDISKVPARSARRIVKQAGIGSGFLWMLTWD